jgi:hypothetical protein
METRYNLVPKTKNAKTGPRAALYTSRNTCPETCPLKGNGCYAESGPIALAWNKCRMTLAEVIAGIQKLPYGSRLRLFPAGDMPGEGMAIDTFAMQEILLTCMERGLTVWGYTHKDTDIEFLLWANRLPGITISVSCSTQEECDIYRSLDLPTTVPVANLEAIEQLNKRFIPCQHSITQKPCTTCNLCMSKHLKTICFPVHGAGKNKAGQALQ